MAEDHLFEIEFTDLLYGGDALGRLPDGRAVFVPFVLPGEYARIRLTEERKSHSRGELIKLLKTSRERITPRCSHFGFCGGCQYQHIEYQSQIAFKHSILTNQLVRIAGISNPPVTPPFPSRESWFYRNTVQFHLSEEGRVGFQKFASHQVVPIKECFLPEGVLNEIWPSLHFDSGAGFDRIGLRVGKEDDVLLVLESHSPPSFEFEMDLPISVVHISPEGPVVLAGDDYCVMCVKERHFKVSGSSFFQVNTVQAEAMVDYLVKELSPNRDAVLLDIYCGVGLFSAFFAALVKRIVAIELNETACEDFAANLDEFDNVELFVGGAEMILPSLSIKPDMVIVDPPRSGLELTVLNALLKLKSEQIAYVSCDPATLARDLKRIMTAGYSIESVKLFDLFPQTYHIESITILKRR
jgi:23S rRNA (uracil1939-C5)-methyltransferase